MGFVKGMITGVLIVAGAVVGAAVIGVIKDEKKEKEEMKKAAEEIDKENEEYCKAYEGGMKSFTKHVGRKVDKMASSL